MANRSAGMAIAEEYTQALQRTTGLSGESLRSFWQLPYQEAIEIALDEARGGGSGAAYGLSRDVLLSVPYRPEPDPSEIVALLTQKILMQKIYQLKIFTHYADFPSTQLLDRVDFIGLDLIENSFRSGRPVCVLNGHCGPGQLVSYFLSRLGYPIFHIGSRNVFKFFNLQGHEYIECFQTTEFHLTTIASGLQALRSGRILHTTGDGFKGTSGRRRAFLGKLRHVPEGYAYMAAQTGAISIPVFCELDEHGALSVTFHEPLPDLPPETARREVTDQIVEHYLALLERQWKQSFGNIPDRFVRQHRGFEDAPADLFEAG